MHSIPNNPHATTSRVTPVLRVRDLTVEFDTPDGVVTAVDALSFDLYRGRTLGIVGESGSGKSQTVLALVGLLASNGRVKGLAQFEGQNLLNLSRRPLNALRGRRIAMIFQDPMAALNPYLRISAQMIEVLLRHARMTPKAARIRSIEALEAVHIPDAARRIDRYAHEFSGGMRQRVMIAMALLCKPDIIVADEPTTALDVTVQAQILAVLREIQRDHGTSIIMITHDLGVVAESCDDVVVLYGGQVMEQASVDALFTAARHPYTAGLLAAVPRLDRNDASLRSIPGNPPDMSRLPRGCPFSPRCEYAIEKCFHSRPVCRSEGGRLITCHLDAAPVRSGYASTSALDRRNSVSGKETNAFEQ